MNAPAPVPCDPTAHAWLSHPAFLAQMNLLQAVITRLAGNSASCKTWCSGLVTALLSLAGSTHAPQLLQLAWVPVATFAFLDMNYLAEEKRFRRRFEALAALARAGHFSCAELFDFGRVDWLTRGKLLFRAAISWSVWPYYGGLVAAYIIAHCAGWLDLLAKPAGS
jgi:hypothetical protein